MQQQIFKNAKISPLPNNYNAYRHYQNFNKSQATTSFPMEYPNSKRHTKVTYCTLTKDCKHHKSLILLQWIVYQTRTFLISWAVRLQVLQEQDLADDVTNHNSGCYCLATTYHLPKWHKTCYNHRGKVCALCKACRVMLNYYSSSECLSINVVHDVRVSHSCTSIPITKHFTHNFYINNKQRFKTSSLKN